jgi:hypothetical protein
MALVRQLTASRVSGTQQVLKYAKRGYNGDAPSHAIQATRVREATVSRRW